MTSDKLATWWVHTVTVETLRGDSGIGPLFDKPTQVACWCVDKQKLVRGKDGQEVLSEVQIAAPLSERARFMTGSRVTTPAGRHGIVVAVAVADSGALNLPDHVEVSLA